MSRNRRQSMDGYKKIVGWILSLTLLAVLTFLSVQRKANSPVEKMIIEINEADGQKSLVTKSYISKRINAYLGYDVNMATIDDISLMELEEIILADERIKSAEMYLDAANKLHVKIEEKKVIVRVKSKETTYYLDEHGDKINVTVGRVARVPIASGDIEDYDQSLISSKRKSNLKDIYMLAKEINKDEFLSALIEQMDIDINGIVTMVPKIGKEKINLSVSDLEEKLFKLKYFYKDGLPKEGWSKFSVIDLDIRDQVVATLKK